MKEKTDIFRPVVVAMVVAIQGVVKYGFHCIEFDKITVCRSDQCQLRVAAPTNQFILPNPSIQAYCHRIFKINQILFLY